MHVPLEIQVIHCADELRDCRPGSYASVRIVCALDVAAGVEVPPLAAETVAAVHAEITTLLLQVVKA